LSQLRGDAFTDLLAGVPFQITPTVDTVTAEADAQHSDSESLVDQDGQPGQDRRPGQGSGARSRRSTGSPEGSGADDQWPPDILDVIDEYDYERWFGHTDDDQRWVDQHWADPDHNPADADRLDRDQTNDAQPGRDQAARSRADINSRFETGNSAGGVPAGPAAAGGTAGQVAAGAAGVGTAVGGQFGTGGHDQRSGLIGANSRFESGNSAGGVPAGPAAAGGTGSQVGRSAVGATAARRPQVTSTVTDSRFETGNSASRVLAGNRCGRCGGRLVSRPGVVQVSVRLSTLLGRDDHPGLLAGFGPIPADVARQIAHDPRLDPLWRWSVFDACGDLLHHGTTNHRPRAADRSDSCSAAEDRACTCPRVEVGERRSTVEIQLTPADLTGDHDPTWAAVIADITAQVDADARTNPPDKWSQVDEHGRLRHHGHTGRHPTAEEAAFIRARDRTCRAPHCRRPATACDIDHALEHHRGGPSHRGNCRCLCRRHHTLRHTPGVTVTDQQTNHGRITTWTLPDGRTYHVTHDKDIILTIDDDQTPVGDDHVEDTTTATDDQTTTPTGEETRPGGVRSVRQPGRPAG
jgi:hypothetical protein